MTGFEPGTSRNWRDSSQEGGRRWPCSVCIKVIASYLFPTLWLCDQKTTSKPLQKRNNRKRHATTDIITPKRRWTHQRQFDADRHSSQLGTMHPLDSSYRPERMKISAGQQTKRATDNAHRVFIPTELSPLMNRSTSKGKMRLGKACDAFVLCSRCRASAARPPESIMPMA